MNFQEFQTAINPILARWPRAYSGDQVQLIHDEVKAFSRADFDRLVKLLLGSHRQAPMVPDFQKGIQSIGIRPMIQIYSPTQSVERKLEDNFLYCIRDNIWADNHYIYIREGKPTFIIKADAPSHPLVLEDSQVREERIKEVRAHLSKNTYSRFIDSLSRPQEGMRKAFSMEDKR